MTVILAVLAAYLIGILPVEYFFIKRSYVRPPYGLYVLYFAKGVCAVLFAWMYAGALVAYFCAVIVVISHMYPFYSPYSRPGLIVATGALLILSPTLLLVAIGVFVLSLLAFRQQQISLILAIIALVIFAIILAVGVSVWVICILLAVFICTRPYVKGWYCRRV